MMTASRVASEDPGKRGIALILVLGFLSILFLLSVAFATMMRLERLTARSYIDVVKARHMVDVALTTALDDLDVNIGNAMYPQKAIYVSTGTAMSNDFLGVSDGGLAYIPGSLSNAVVLAAPGTRWFDVSLDPADLTPQLPPLKARVAFLAVNCSGFIDANHAGGAAARLVGTNLQEIAVAATELPGLDITDGAAFAAARSGTWRRFENLPELWELVPNTAWVNPYINTLFAYSYFPTGYIHTAGTIDPPLEIDGTNPDVAAIASKLTSLGFPNPTTLADNLKDYVDPDNIPITVTSFCTESVPMLNEFRLETEITRQGAGSNETVKMAVRFDAELWYPFATNNASSYDVEVRFRQAAGGSTVWGFPNRIPLVYDNPGTEPSPWEPGNEYAVLTGGVESADILLTDGPDLPPAFEMLVQVRESGATVDGINLFAIDTTGAGGLNMDASAPLTPQTHDFSKEANDPRINWDWTLDQQWVDSSTLSGPSFGSPNPGITAATTGDGNTFMYVRNAPMETIGEFGFLLFDENRPWQTIRFLGPTDATNVSHLVLDGFVMQGQTNEHGCVNLNSTNLLSLAAALVNAPKERYPGEPLPPPPNDVLQPAEAGAVAARIIAASTAPPQGFTNVSDIVSVDEAGVLAAIGETDPSLAEAVVRNSAGLLKTRQQLFTILLAAQVQNYQNGDVLAEQRAVAVVWRDPYPDAVNRHPVFVRSFRWLND